MSTGLILQVRGRDGMSTPQNGADAYSQSHVFARVDSRCLPCDFRLPECPSVDIFLIDICFLSLLLVVINVNCVLMWCCR